MIDTNTNNPFDIQNEINLTNYQPINLAIGTILNRISGLKILGNNYQSDNELSKLTEPETFIHQTLKILNIDYQIVSGTTQSVSKQGGLVIVANHPFGGIDGFILGYLARQMRPDVKILANTYLKKIPALESLFIDVDPINKKASMQKNSTSLKHAIKYVRNGGCLIIFPAGEVSHLKLRQQRIVDSE